MGCLVNNWAWWSDLLPGVIRGISLEYAPALRKYFRGLQEFYRNAVGELCTRDFNGREVRILAYLAAQGLPAWQPPAGSPEHVRFVTLETQAALRAGQLAAVGRTPPPNLTAVTYPTLVDWQAAYPRDWNYRPGTPVYPHGGGRYRP
jgi:hypothetical protein